MVFEFRLGDDEQERNPLYAMYMSGRLFLFGSIPSIIPFIFSNDVNLCVLLACILSGVVLFGVGAYKTKTTKGSFLSGFVWAPLPWIILTPSV